MLIKIFSLTFLGIWGIILLITSSHERIKKNKYSMIAAINLIKKLDAETAVKVLKELQDSGGKNGKI